MALSDSVLVCVSPACPGGFFLITGYKEVFGDYYYLYKH